MTDRIMSNRKTPTKDVWRTPFNPAVTDEDVEAPPPKKPVKVVALEIEESDLGGDPYNHTGSFCVPEFEED